MITSAAEVGTGWPVGLCALTSLSRWSAMSSKPVKVRLF
jgi:hypothetical protein